MKRIQKIAWCFVIMFLISLLASLITVAVAYTKVGMPKALFGFAFMGLFGLAGLSPTLFPKEKGEVIYDERDEYINKRAALAGFIAAYLVVGLACMIPFFILGPKAAISVVWLPNIFMSAGILHFLTYSLAILIGYGREAKGENQ
jgi:hypothetical protein